MPGAVETTLELSTDLRNVRVARDLVREAVFASELADHLDRAVLAVSEIVTNAFVHVGSTVQVRVLTAAGSVRVEVTDAGSHLPVRRLYPETSGTGRGLRLVEDSVDRWGVAQHHHGKVVWFEIGATPTEDADLRLARQASGSASSAETVEVTLRHVPLLMHVAWQEHAATLLREYLLHVMDSDEGILDKHAQASAAMSVLEAQLPAPPAVSDPDGLMAESLEPLVTADEVVLRIPRDAVPHFGTLDALLRAAILEARAGRMLSPPTQPEIDEMRQWLCSEVARQAGGETTATPWVARTDIRATLADQAELTRRFASLAAEDEPVLATDEASIIVAASGPALRLLGYATAGDLLGRRVIAVVPSRFHQAHIAGTTMNATNGRDRLLGVPLVVPMVRADGTEVMVSIEVRPQRLPDGARVFVARFRAA